MYVQVIHFL